MSPMGVVTYTNGTVQVQVDERDPDLHRRLLREGWTVVEKAKPTRRKKADTPTDGEDAG